MKKQYFYIAVLFLGAALGIASFLLRPLSDVSPNPEGVVEINYFYSETCHVCSQMSPFLAGLVENEPLIQLNKLSLSNQDNVKQLLGLYQKHQVPQAQYGSVPAVFIQDKYFIGLSEEIKQEIIDYTKLLVGQEQLTTGATSSQAVLDNGFQPANFSQIKLPLIGLVEVKKYSLPVLSAVLGAFDGFNVCSMGALVLILGLVLALKSRKQIFLFGGIYLLTTAIAYGFLILLWYKLFQFLSNYLVLMQVFIGVLGFVGGAYFLREFLKDRKSGPNCQIESGKKIANRFALKMKGLMAKKARLAVLALSVILFAFMITAVEFPCSAAVPLFFAGVLAQSHLALWQEISLIGLFLLFYLIDEIIIFVMAVLTMTIKLASPKITTYIALLESIVLFLLGFYYLFGFLFV